MGDCLAGPTGDSVPGYNCASVLIERWLEKPSTVFA